MSNTEIDEASQVVHEARDPFRVVNLLPGPRLVPSFNQE
jgi:hypothetical protein